MMKNNTLQNIYVKLLNAFGAQGWWPITSTANAAGFDERGYHRGDYTDPKTSGQKFEIVLGAILAQNTNWKNVEKSLLELKKEDVLSPQAINKISRARLAKLIRSSGYFNQKADRIKGIADYLLKKYGGDIQALFDKPTAELRVELLSMNGIGPETADSILLYAAHKPSFVIDAYTRRIMSRVGVCSKDVSYNELQQLFHAALPSETALFNEYHALLVELAKRRCTKRNPVCTTCPITNVCKKRV